MATLLFVPCPYRAPPNEKRALPCSGLLHTAVYVSLCRNKAVIGRVMIVERTARTYPLKTHRVRSRPPAARWQRYLFAPVVSPRQQHVSEPYTQASYAVVGVAAPRRCVEVFKLGSTGTGRGGGSSHSFCANAVLKVYIMSLLYHVEVTCPLAGHVFPRGIARSPAQLLPRELDL
jgi:hypothetical protein